jgi:hypothetical protein
LQLRRASRLSLVRHCQHDGPPTESRPCEEQARTAIQRANHAWEGGPERIQELCNVSLEAAGRPTRGMVPVGAPVGGSEFSPGSSDSESDSDSSGSEDSHSSDSETEDSDSSETGTEDSAPFDIEMREQGPLMSDTDGLDSSSTHTEDSDSSSANSGFEKPSSSDTEEEVFPFAPLLEEIEEIGKAVAGLKSRAMQQVRRFLAMLARMRKDLSPSARIELIKELGWHLGPGRGSRGAGGSGRGPEPTWLLEGTSRIMNKLDDWQRTYEDHEERFRAVREEMATLDDGLACAEERLAAKRAAGLEERAKEVEQWLPVIAARLGILWNEVTGSGRPVPSEIQLTSTGTEMSTEEHVVTAETHLQYAEGNLQPSEEHLADAEVHLKLVTCRTGCGRAS